ncbi:LIM-domain binding protein-domain-containing protein [Chaetomium strumarium]|uniref:LIM-domain binding protein-domain-containing protein n=1 Tax=Chaetomium strumarium TaxID=1170767 RepID=A0AAJ0GQB4_9PEZI|nr:LIM-domain binding protein-domain-containing protein [Chaetomium strumarium]
MGHNPSQPGAAPGGIPHQLVGHMGVSGPGPQINAAALMGGMPPGAGNPNAHAMQHLSPAQAQMFHHPQLNQMYAANNPALQQQMQQHRLQMLQQQQHARQALMTHGAFGAMNTAGMGIPLGQMNPAQAAQMAALRRMPVASPMHLQQAQLAQQQQGQPMNPNMMAHQLALQQQQMQMNQQGGNPNQHPMNPQHLNQMQQAQLAALQAQQAQQAQAEARMQAQAQAQAQHQAAQAAQAQQQGPGQSQQAQQVPQPPPGQQQQQPPPPGQGGPGANGSAPTPGATQGHTPQPNPQQQPQAPPQTPQVTQAQQQAQMIAQVQQAQQQQAQQQQAQQQAQQQHAANLASLMQQRRDQMALKGGMHQLKMLQFCEQLSGFPGSKGRDDLDYWNKFVQHFFSQKGIFRHTILVRDGEDQGQEKQYEIAYPALARYFHTHFESGVKHMQLVLDKGTAERPLPNDCHLIENQKASLVYWFEDNSHLVAQGILRVQFDSESRFDLFEFQTTAHEEYISRRVVIQAARPAHNWVKEWRSLNQQDPKQSPELTKKGKPKPAKVPARAPPDLDLPHSVVKSGMGITEAVYQFLEMVEIMNQMGPLFGYYHAHPGLAPYAALDQYVSQINAQINASAPQGMNGQQMAQGGPRTPGFGQFQMGASPAMANSMLPGSPHITGSPIPGQMAAPTMQLQPSQQGSSSGPSANTSPAQNSNKRRRPSTVKNEDEAPTSAPTPAAMGTPQLNGVQIKGKQPPTPRMQKRHKTGNNPGV